MPRFSSGDPTGDRAARNPVLTPSRTGHRSSGPVHRQDRYNRQADPRTLSRALCPGGVHRAFRHTRTRRSNRCTWWAPTRQNPMCRSCPGPGTRRPGRHNLRGGLQRGFLPGFRCAAPRDAASSHTHRAATGTASVCRWVSSLPTIFLRSFSRQTFLWGTQPISARMRSFLL